MTPSTFKTRLSSGKWYIDEHHPEGDVSRTFKRFPTEAEAQAEADQMTADAASTARFLARRAAREEASRGHHRA